MRLIETVEQYNELLESDKLVVLDIFAEWCGPCKMLTPILEGLSEEYGDEVEMVKIDADNGDMMPVLTEFKVRSIPTVVMLKNKEVKEAFIGAKPKSEIQKLIDSNK